MRKIIVVLLCLGFIGCATTIPSIPYNSCSYDDCWNKYVYNDYEIQIISEPSGARIEWNNEYVGETPLAIKANGSYYAGVIIVAYPSKDGKCVQQKFLPNSNVLPRKIYFNMDLCPSKEKYDIDIH